MKKGSNQTVTTNPAGDVSALRDGIREMLLQACPDPTPPTWLDGAVDSVTNVVARFGDEIATQNAHTAITIRDLAAQPAVLRRAVRRWLIRRVNDGQLTRELADDALTSFAMSLLPHTYAISATVHIQATMPLTDADDAAALRATRDAITTALTGQRSTVTDVELHPAPRPHSDGQEKSDHMSGADGGDPAAGDDAANAHVRVAGTVDVTITLSAADRQEALTTAMTRLLQPLIPAIGEITTDVGLIEIDTVRPARLPLDPDRD